MTKYFAMLRFISYREALRMPSPEAYETLLLDVLLGDATLFMRGDQVEAAWHLVAPILRNVTPIHEYEPNTWGPEAADRIIASDGGWHNPKPEEAIG
jgi:glucose-6-phosphate 1-dehydrogenase